jgi:hypothetical protein
LYVLCNRHEAKQRGAIVSTLSPKASEVFVVVVVVAVIVAVVVAVDVSVIVAVDVAVIVAVAVVVVLDVYSCPYYDWKTDTACLFSSPTYTTPHTSHLEQQPSKEGTLLLFSLFFLVLLLNIYIYIYTTMACAAS